MKSKTVILLVFFFCNNLSAQTYFVLESGKPVIYEKYFKDFKNPLTSNEQRQSSISEKAYNEISKIWDAYEDLQTHNKGIDRSKSKDLKKLISRIVENIKNRDEAKK